MLLQGIVIGTGHDSEFGEIFKMMQGEEVNLQKIVWLVLFTFHV